MKRRAHKLILVLAASLFLTAGGVSEARADPGQGLENLPAPLREYLIKAAFLYNFARFTRWPSDAFQGASSPLRLCILGKDPFGPTLETIAKKKVAKRRIVISHLVWAEDAPECHVLFISASAHGRLGELFKLLDGKPVLTVSDEPGIVRSGSVIGLEIVDRKVRFRVNVDAAEGAGLKLSSRLLNLAIIVRNEPKAGMFDRQSTAVPRD